MKAILYTLITILFVGYSSISSAQDTLNKPFKGISLDVKISVEPDTSNIDLTDGYRDDIQNYYDRGDRDTGDTLDRLIYFVHGLGGNINSWKGSYDALVPEYHYQPTRIDYHQNQKNFFNATYEALTEMVDERIVYEYLNSAKIDSGAYEFPPYAIGHSQGGLVIWT